MMTLKDAFLESAFRTIPDDISKVARWSYDNNPDFKAKVDQAYDRAAFELLHDPQGFWAQSSVANELSGVQKEAGK